MRNELETYQLIDQYLNGELADKEMASIEDRIASDPEFAEMVDVQRMTSIVVLGTYQYHVREKVKHDLAQIDRKRKIVKRGLEGLLSILLVVSIFYMYWKKMEGKPFSAKPEIKKEEVKKLNSVPESVESPVPIQRIQRIQMPSANAKVPTEMVEESKSAIAHTVPTVPIKEDSIAPVLPNKTLEHTAANTLTTEKVHDCAAISIIVQPKVTSTCEDEQTGMISFENSTFHGGKPPYTISMKKKGADIINTQFYGLASGNYSFTVSDGYRCHSELEVFVPGKKCRNNKFVFNPSAGENLQIPLKENRPYVFTLRNRAGAVVYTHNFSPNPFHDWNGLNLSDQHQSSDLYIYSIEYDNGQLENGQITILK